MAYAPDFEIAHIGVNCADAPRRQSAAPSNLRFCFGWL